MRIDSVELKNIGVIEAKTFDLSSNLVAVVGPNGAGKSTLLASIYAALTNDFSRFGSSKATAVNNASAGANAYIRLHGQHHGRKFTLTRSLVPSKSEFVWDQDSSTKLTKADAVDNEVRTILGVSKTILDKYVFVQQGSMFDFLDQTPSVRAKVFQHMCGVDEAADVYRVCSAFLSKNKPHEVVDNTAQIEADITQLRQSLLEASTAVKGAMRQMLSAEAREEIAAQLAAAERYARLSPQAWNARDQLAKAEAEVQALTQQIQELDSQIAPRQAWLAENRPHYEAGKAAVEADTRNQSLQSRRADLERQKAQLQLTLSSLLPPTSDSVLSPEESSEALKLCGQFRVAVQQAEAVRNQQAGQQCPTCLQPIQESHVAKISQQGLLAGEALRKLESRLQASSAALAGVDRYTREKSRIEQLISSVESQLSALQSVTTTTAVVVDDKLTQFIADYTRVAYEEQEKRQHKDRLAAQLAGRQSTVQVWQAEVQKAEEALRNTRALSEQELAALREKIRVADEASYTYRLHRTLHSNRAVLLGKLWSQRDAVLAQIEQAAQRTKILDTVNTVMNTFHWDNLPRHVTQSNLELLVADINANLVQFQSPFSVQVSDELGFQAFFPDRNPLDAQQLSGGQKVMLALAFRLSLDRIFGGSIGMLFLDEPSAGLDVQNQLTFYGTLRDIVARTSEPRQVVVVTHTHGLGQFFDAVVNLGDM